MKERISQELIPVWGPVMIWRPKSLIHKPSQEWTGNVGERLVYNLWRSGVFNPGVRWGGLCECHLFGVEGGFQFGSTLHLDWLHTSITIGLVFYSCDPFHNICWRWNWSWCCNSRLVPILATHNTLQYFLKQRSLLIISISTLIFAIGKYFSTAFPLTQSAFHNYQHHRVHIWPSPQSAFTVVTLIIVL